MKKFIKFFVYICVLLGSMAVLSSCGLSSGSSGGGDEDTRVTITEEMISRVDYLSYNDGEPVEFDTGQIHIWLERVRLRLDSDFTVTYQNNINAGTATATLTMNEDNSYAKGSVTFEFLIKPKGTLDVTTLDQLEEALLDTNHTTIRVVCAEGESLDDYLIIPEGKELVVAENKYLYFQKNNGYTVYNYGKIVVMGGQYGGIGFRAGTFFNCGEIECHGEIWNNSYFYNEGTMSLDKKIDNRGSIYTNSPIETQRTSSSPFDYIWEKYVLRTQIPEEDVTLASTNIEYVDGEGKPTVLYQGSTAPASLFDYTYTDNTTLGVASIQIKVKKDNKEFYGTFVREYNIVKGTISVSDFDDLKAKQQVGLYGKFVCPNSFTIGENFTIAQDESLTIKNLTIPEGVELMNNGSLLSTENGNLSIKGTLNTYGNIDCVLCYISGSGTLNTYSDSVSNIRCLSGWTGAFSNAGNFVATNMCNIYGAMTNAGSFECMALNLTDNTITNSGTIRISGGGTTINEWGTANIYNTGKIINAVKTAYDNRNSTFENVENGIETSAEIWAINPLQNLSTNVVLRQNLAEMSFELSGYSFDYDQTSHKPSVIVGGEVYTRATSAPEYIYSSGAQDTTCTRVGTIDVSLTIKDTDYFCQYYGTNSASYTINSVLAEISSASQFMSRLSDSNWSGYKLMADINLHSSSYSSYTLYGSQTFDSNGHKIIIDTDVVFIIYGTLLLSSVERESLEISNVALCLKGNGMISIYGEGRITNNDVIYIERGGTAYIHSDGGTIDGTGTIYTYAGAEMINSSNYRLSCTTYNRKIIDNMNGQDLYLDHTEFTYSGTTKVPQVLARYNGNDVSATEHLLVTVNGGEPCIYHGDYEVAISSKGDFDEYFVGNATRTFTINSNVFNITSVSQWTQSTFDNTSYDRFDLCANISVTENISLRDHCILNFGTYRITNIKTSSKKNITSNATSEIWITITTSDELSVYSPYVNRVTLDCDACGPSTNQLFMFDFYNASASSLPIIDSNRTLFTLDLNGHNITHGISIGNTLDDEVTFNIINSTTMVSNIYPYSTSSSNPSFQVTGSKGLMHLNMIGQNTTGTTKNIIIRGFELGTNNGSHVNINAKNVRFDTSGTSVSIGARIGYASASGSATITNINSYFDRCHFYGATAVVVAGGTSSTMHVFDTCTISSSGNAGGADVDSGMVVCQSTTEGYFAKVYVAGGSVSSSNGYGIYVTQGNRNRYGSSVASVYYYNVSVSYGTGKARFSSGMIDNHTSMFHNEQP